MQPRLRQFSLVAGFVLLACLLVGNAILTYRALYAQIDTGRWVMHTRQVRLELWRAETLLVDAETGQRGYLLTGDPKYLAPYQVAVSQIDARIETLAELTADNPVQQRNIAELRPLVHEKLSELDRTVALYRAGHADQARSIVVSNLGLQTMDGIRRILADMQQEEMRLDSARSDEYRHNVMMAQTSIWVASLAALLALAGLGWYVAREHHLRETHAAAIGTREAWFRTTLSSIGDAVIATDRDGNVTFMNPVAEKLTRRTLVAARGKGIAEVFPIFNEMTLKPVEDPVGIVMESGHVVGLANHTVLRSADGNLIPIEDSAAPIRDDEEELIGVVLVFRDVTSERKQEELLRRTEKLSAAARLSATMAHEINNPLEAVTNLVYLARHNPDVPPMVLEQLAQAEHELHRVAHITRQTLGFYRESGARERVEIPELVESVLQIYRNKLADRRIEVTCELSGCPPVEGLLGELRQAVSNLIANAIDASNVGGRIHVSAKAAADGMVEMVVADEGPGVAPEHLHRVFEPFFTTKRDVGTGLGLWATKGIVERHGGSVQILPAKENCGAAFAIHLPSAASDDQTEAS